MGVLAPGSAHARPSAPFRRTFPQSHLQTSPQPLKSHIQIFRTLGQFLKLPHLSAHNAEGRGGP